MLVREFLKDDRDIFPVIARLIILWGKLFQDTAPQYEKLVFIETKPQFNIFRSSTSFTFGYPNLMLSQLQYISFHFNINIATFVGFQIAVYAYIVLRLLHTSQAARGLIRLLIHC